MEVHVDRIVTGKVLSVDHELLVFTLDDFNYYLIIKTGTVSQINFF